MLKLNRGQIYFKIPIGQFNDRPGEKAQTPLAHDLQARAAKRRDPRGAGLLPFDAS